MITMTIKIVIAHKLEQEVLIMKEHSYSFWGPAIFNFLSWVVITLVFAL